MRKQHRILVVDDEEATRVLLAEMAESLGYEVESARDGFEAGAKLKLDIDLVLLDARMPGMDGFAVAQKIRADETYADVPILMATALESREDRLRAVEAGVNDFITKPFDQTELKLRVASLLRMKDAQDALKGRLAELERKANQRANDLREALQQMGDAQRREHEAHLDTVHRLAMAAEYKDENSGRHILRVRQYCELLGRALNLTPGGVELLSDAAPLHDIGKIAIPDAVLLKPGSLDEAEWETMKKHTTIGADMLSGSSSELLRAGETIALSHHEKWDGSGYPQILRGEDIPLWGRICAVADVFDSLTSDRPYRKALDEAEALEIMKEQRGGHFDPKILDVFFQNSDEALKIKQGRSEAAGEGMAESPRE